MKWMGREEGSVGRGWGLGGGGGKSYCLGTAVEQLREGTGAVSIERTTTPR